MSLNDITLRPIVPDWLVLLLVGVALVSAVVQYFLLRRRLTRRRAFCLSLLRAGALSLLLLFPLNPSLVKREERKVAPAIAVLLDTSPSMGLPGREEKRSRLDEAKGLLLDGSEPLLKSLMERFEVKLYSFGDSLRPLEMKEVSALGAGEREGDLTEALPEIGGKSALTLLLSDGTFGGRSGSFTGSPVLSVPVGDRREYRDILIKEAHVPPLAFREREVTIDVTIKGHGYKGATVPVLLKDGNRLLTAKNVSLEKDPDEKKVSLSFTPEEVGQRRLSISTLPQAGEKLLANNAVNFSLKVVRDKIRILMVSGNPSMNYRFMRMAFKNDPSIDLLSFVILRTPTDILNVPLHEQSLIPFPVETLFTKDLKNFDVLIFDNFAHQLYFNPKYLESIRDFVKEGGGFGMIGGPSHFSGYAGTPVEEILPVKVERKTDYSRDASWKVKLSRTGRNHPVTRFSADGGSPASLWQEMPGLDGINFLEPKNSGAVLLESADGAPKPILTVGTYGKGRSLVLATDYSWKWYMGMVAKGRGNWAYLRLVEKMARWLSRDPDLDPVQVVLPEGIGEIGKEREIKIRMKEEAAASGGKPGIFLSVFNPAGLKVDSRIKTGGQPGEYVGSFLPNREGTYRVKVEAGGGSVEEFVTIAGPLSSLDGAPDPERLKELATATGGRILAGKEEILKEIESHVSQREKRIVEEQSTPLWSLPYVLAFVLALLGMEWYFRRRWGLI